MTALRSLPAEGSRDETVTAFRIEGIGAEGDGYALSGGERRWFPATLPTELVTPDGELLEPSPERVAPPCRHFGPCGGCTVQHWADTPYAAWKQGLFAAALRRLGFTGDLPPLARTPPGARRRMDLAIRRENGAVRLGLHVRRSASVVDMAECPVLHPALFAVVAALRPVLRSLAGLKRAGSAVVNLLDAGPDLLLRTDAPLSATDRGRLAAFATAQGLPRVSWSLDRRGAEAEPAALLRPARHAFAGGPATSLPPGAFLQASAEGEAAIREAVLAALPPLRTKARIIELFAGCGTLTHALATRARVEAFEGDAEAVRALRDCRNPRVSAVERDLVRRPLQLAEMKGAACVVLDPPFAGAAAQIPALAASGVPIIYVSCNPVALERDGAALRAAGYRVTAGAAIDQFLWSGRVEGVAVFTKP